jgi:hypothetical protein
VSTCQRSTAIASAGRSIAQPRRDVDTTTSAHGLDAVVPVARRREMRDRVALAAIDGAGPTLHVVDDARARCLTGNGALGRCPKGRD